MVWLCSSGDVNMVCLGPQCKDGRLSGRVNADTGEGGLGCSARGRGYDFSSIPKLLIKGLDSRSWPNFKVLSRSFKTGR